MLDRAFELRYQVYCLERNFLPSAHYPDQRETDEHDGESAHFGAVAPGDELVGYVRLVRPRNGVFPFQRFCTTLLNDVSLPDPHSAAEISRLMVRQDYRNGGRRKSLRRIDENDLATDSVTQRPSEASNILLELYRGMFTHCAANGIRHVYAAMERSLARSLRRWNLSFTQISAETDYFGPVALYSLDLRALEARLVANNPDFLAWLRSPQQERLHAVNVCHIQHLPVSPSARPVDRPSVSHAVLADAMLGAARQGSAGRLAAAA